MSRNRTAAGAVRGPASALTSFLAGLGVEPSTRLTTWGNTATLPNHNANAADGDQEVTLAPDGPVIHDDSHLDPAGAVTARTTVAGPSQVGEGIPELEEDAKLTRRRRQRQGNESASSSGALGSPPLPKRRGEVARAVSVNSDDLDSQTVQGTVISSKSAVHGQESPSKGNTGNAVLGPLKAVGDFMICGECGNKFTVTAYTKEHPTHSSTWLCLNCCYALGIDPFAKPKKSKMKAPSRREDRAKVVHYEERKGVASLGETCIHLIGRYIERVEQLGDIGGVNMEKVCKIISRNRRLTPETAALFYAPDRTDLTMFDCTRLSQDSYITLSKLCPRLERLHLHLCGQLTTDSITSWGKNLKHLRRLELFAPFLVRKEGWISFFKATGKRLEGLLVTQSPRIDLETLAALAKSCPNLTELQLAEIGQLDGDCLEAIGKLKRLTVLRLPSSGRPLSDTAVETLLSKVGGQLESLDLSDNPDLTDAVLLAIAEHCPRLRRLYLRHLVELTDQGVAYFFTRLYEQQRAGFEVIDLEKGQDLRSEALQALVAHSGGTVEKLSLLGWREVDQEGLGDLTKCVQLKELDLGWVREVRDLTIKEILDACDHIQLIKVWGCNNLTDAIPRKKGVKIVGIETHTI